LQLSFFEHGQRIAVDATERSGGAGTNSLVPKER